MTKVPKQQSAGLDPFVENENVFKRTIENIKARCEAANINISRIDGGIFYDDEFNVSLKQGRGSREVNLYDAKTAIEFSKINFEKYRFIAGYAATYSNEYNTLEAVLRPLSPASAVTVRRRLFGNPSQDTESTATTKIVLKSNEHGHKIELGDASSELMTLIQNGGKIIPLALKLSGFSTETHDVALETLQKIADAFLIQLDLVSSVSLQLVRDRQNRAGVAASTRAFAAVQKMHYPQHEYDHAPVSLYQYGRGALGMPLLQFLAFYQVVEFYYPTYSDTEARKRVRNLLKDSAFRADRDADIGRLLTTIQSKNGLASERSQLKATIRECVNDRHFRDFLAEDTARLEYYKEQSKRGNYTKLTLNGENTDILDELANRMYQIRCEIVHTKENADEPPIKSRLLPNSVEADQLQHDISLMQYIAQRVLISSSRILA